ncbi:hypothetical protein Dsin_009240 [Dipteronia sinensis]|uniref:AP2/ERF domain-containing protein n=1 Tax=Dipteronia sinensis TaxID=43782 RepID=A0AAE0AQX4_9ROSI|nr:hypothetical protein Dsin_009240 [Dipteronia sinensis]
MYNSSSVNRLQTNQRRHSSEDEDRIIVQALTAVVNGTIPATNDDQEYTTIIALPAVAELCQVCNNSNCNGCQLFQESKNDDGGGSGERAGKKYIGVRERRKGKWVVEIHETKKKRRKWLGTFNTAEDAAAAYDQAAIKFRGVKTKLNFPVSNYNVEEILGTTSNAEGRTMEIIEESSKDQENNKFY